MLERQYLSRRGGARVVYPECQFLQYIIPCFVANYLDTHKDPSVPQDKKKEFLKFVHNLIESYETKEFCQEVQIKKDPFTFHARGSEVLIEKVRSLQEHAAKNLKVLTGKVYDSLFSKNSVSKDSNCLKNWTFQMFMFFSRVNTCVKKLDDPPESSFDWFSKFMLKFDPSLVELGKMCRKLHEPLEKCEDSQRSSLTPQQIFGITVFSFFDSLKRNQFKSKMRSSQGPGFPLDDIDSAMWALYTEDKWTVKQKVSSMAHKSGQGDQTLDSLELAKSNVFYEEALKSGLTEEGKVKMSRPGEITFFPVKHCRWCGLLEADTFRKCPVCVDNPDFPDVNYFCSLNCETEALDQQHTEEHATFLMIRCGIR